MKPGLIAALKEAQESKISVRVLLRAMPMPMSGKIVAISEDTFTLHLDAGRDPSTGQATPAMRAVFALDELWGIGLPDESRIEVPKIKLQ